MAVGHKFLLIVIGFHWFMSSQSWARSDLPLTPEHFCQGNFVSEIDFVQMTRVDEEPKIKVVRAAEKEAKSTIQTLCRKLKSLKNWDIEAEMNIIQNCDRACQQASVDVFFEGNQLRQKISGVALNIKYLTTRDRCLVACSSVVEMMRAYQMGRNKNK